MADQHASPAQQLAAHLRPAHLDGVSLVVGGGNYRRGDDGVWRYAFTGEPVPGATDVTLAERYAAAPRRRIGAREYVLLDQVWASRPELEWCVRYTRMKAPDLDGETVAVPREEFVARGGVVVALHAPELHPEDMLTTNQVAAAAGVRPDTIAGYRSRGQMPEPALVVGRSRWSTPLWPRPVIRHWLTSRRGRRSS